MLETPNKVDEEKVTKKKNISLSRDPTASFPWVIVDNVDKQYILLMIEAEETPQTITVEIWNMMLYSYWMMR